MVHANMSQCVVFEIVTYAMIEYYFFDLTRNDFSYYVISTLISLTSYVSK